VARRLFRGVYEVRRFFVAATVAKERGALAADPSNADGFPRGEVLLRKLSALLVTAMNVRVERRQAKCVRNVETRHHMVNRWRSLAALGR
jgi:hypothetical protein